MVERATNDGYKDVRPNSGRRFTGGIINSPAYSCSWFSAQSYDDQTCQQDRQTYDLPLVGSFPQENKTQEGSHQDTYLTKSYNEADVPGISHGKQDHPIGEVHEHSGSSCPTQRNALCPGTFASKEDEDTKPTGTGKPLKERINKSDGNSTVQFTNIEPDDPQRAIIHHGIPRGSYGSQYSHGKGSFNERKLSEGEYLLHGDQNSSCQDENDARHEPFP